MKALVIQNSTIADAGIVGHILTENHGFELTTVRPETSDLAQLDTSDADLVVLLGSPHGVYDRHIPWIEAEFTLAQRLLYDERPVFGICFGGQMLASAAGAAVGPMGQRYNGWIENDSAVDETWRGPWFRWHGDRFDIPSGADLLAIHDGIPQGFQLGNAVGVQFHPEVDEKIVTSWVSNSTQRLLEKGIDPETFLNEAIAQCRRVRPQAERLVSDVLERCMT
jgi:GMP synthase-like glutamine amidotransferase